VRLTRRAAEFCTSCSLLIWHSRRPDSREFPLSRRDNTKATTRRAVVSRSRYLRILPMRYIHFFTAEGGSQCVRFNGKGGHMLSNTETNQVVVYDLYQTEKAIISYCHCCRDSWKGPVNCPRIRLFDRRLHYE